MMNNELNVWDLIILLAVLAAVILSAVRILRRKKAGSDCSGNCDGCSLCSASCPASKKEKPE